MDWAVATQTNGFEVVLYWSVNSVICSTSSLTLRKDPRLMAHWLIRPNQRST